MSLPYRTVLHLPGETDLTRLAENEVQAWIESGRKVDAKRRGGFLSGEFLEPGVHQLKRGCTLSVARLETAAGGGRTTLYRLDEANKSGTWRVDVIALDSDGRGADTLIVEASRQDQLESDDPVAPPRVVKQLLARERVFDSETPVTASPMLAHASEVEDVFTAITDVGRSVTVVVAASMDDGLNEPLRKYVAQLTSELVGLSAVFVLTRAAADALNARLPRSHQLEVGRVRTYLPLVDLNDPIDGRRHRVLGPKTFARGISGSRVAPFLQKSFAYQTRSALLAKPLPRSMRRQLAALDDSLSTLARAALVEQQVLDVRKETERETAQLVRPNTGVKRTKIPAVDGLIARLLRYATRWLERSVTSLDDSLLEELDVVFTRRSAEVDALEKDLAASEARIGALSDELQSLSEDFDFRGLELAEAESNAAKATDRVRYLQRKLVEAGNGADAFGEFASSEWEAPNDLSELVLLLTPGISDHAITGHVEFTGDPDRAAEADRRDQNGLWVQRCWEFVRALYDYAELKAQGEFAGNVHMYLSSADHDGFKVPVKRHASVEAQGTMEQWGDERVFPVPVDVSPDGRLAMSAHFKAGTENTFAPRFYYYDDTDRSGRIYVGYIGRHLTNSRTRSA